jgi:hypothetical protein
MIGRPEAFSSEVLSGLSPRNSPLANRVPIDKEERQKVTLCMTKI